MNDHSQQELESGRPEHSAQHLVDYCLKQLYQDRKKKITDTCAGEMTYEELIAALLAARDEIRRIEDADEQETFSFHTSSEKAEVFDRDLLSLIQSSRHGPADTIVKVEWTRSTPI